MKQQRQPRELIYDGLACSEMSVWEAGGNSRALCGSTASGDGISTCTDRSRGNFRCSLLCESITIKCAWMVQCQCHHLDKQQ